MGEWEAKTYQGQRASAKAGARAALNLVFPPQSLLTGAPTTGRNMESELWAAVRFLDDPCCAACGFPFEYDHGTAVLCGACSARKPSYRHARAAMAYDDDSRKLVLDFKHGGHTAGLSIFATHMARAGRAFLGDADFLVPVPLHRSRLLRRRYNQATILGRALAAQTGRAFDAGILRRAKKTSTQGGKSARERRRNVSGAFAVRERAKPRLKGAHIVLIDDVFTSGATLESCARALKKNGAGTVDALTLARVVKPARV
ncbi:MAG: ComF family protein [Robiginitomaculum sp.]